jgi:hypothetical protein
MLGAWATVGQCPLGAALFIKAWFCGVLGLAGCSQTGQFNLLYKKRGNFKVSFKTTP